MPDRYLGRQIGKYRVIRLLGGGAFAWVYEAVDRDLEIPVALKILRPEFAGQPEAEARFRREAATAARLRHPNIVTVRDVGQVDGASFVAMDLLPLSLARRLELLQRLPEADVVRIGLDVAAALAIAHAGGVVHRDIKPDNILIGTHGEAVVADFGLARALSADSAGSGDRVMGTPHYFSPEQARGLELDGRSDLYALGVTLFRAATGRLPFEGDDWYAVARLHVDAPPPSARALVPELSVEFDELVDRLLRKDPAERFGNALQLADALAALPTAPTSRLTPASTRTAASETLSALPSVSRPANAPVPQRGRWFPTALASVAVAVAAWATWQLPSVRALVRNALVSSSLMQQTNAPVPSVSRDSSAPREVSTTGARSGDTAKANDSARRAIATTAKSPAPKGSDSSARKNASAVNRTQLTLTAPDSAVLSVDGLRVGRGTAVVERIGAAQLSVSAVIADAPANCTTAVVRDSLIRLKAGEKRAILLPVRTCVGVAFNVRPSDARIRFQPMDGGDAIEVRADSSVMLPVGKYQIRATAPRCIEYNEVRTVQRTPAGQPLIVRIPMYCPTE